MIILIKKIKKILLTLIKIILFSKIIIQAKIMSKIVKKYMKYYNNIFFINFFDNWYIL